jgi:hypothetical protein
MPPQLAGLNFQQESWISVGCIEFPARKLDFSGLDLIYSQIVGFQWVGLIFEGESWISVCRIYFWLQNLNFS